MPDKSSIYGVNSDGEAVLRTSENAEGDPTSIYGVNSDGEACMRVSSEVTSDDPTSIYGVNDNGEACVRIDGSGGSAPVIEELNVTPSTSTQTITAPEGVNGYNPVNVSAVDSTIDVNIVAGNIKKDVEILGVRGSYEGETPTGSISITNNGTYDVTDKGTAVVAVPTTAPALYREFQLDGTGKLISDATSTHIMDFTGVTDVSDYTLINAYYQNTAISGTINMNSLATISGTYACQNMFSQCSSLTGFSSNSLTTITGKYACYKMFELCSSLTDCYLNSLTTVSGENACQNMFDTCRGLASISLPSLTTVSGYCSCQAMFANCINMITADISSLTTISGGNGCQGMFGACVNLTSVDISSLTTMSGGYACQSMFDTCRSLTSVTFTSLNNISGTNCCRFMFSSCSSLTSLSFPALTNTSFGTRNNQFTSLLSGVTGCTMHFPSNLDPAGGSRVISSLSGYPNFGGTNTVLAFDLPATE